MAAAVPLTAATASDRPAPSPAAAEPLVLRCVRISPHAQLPAYQTAGAAGMDLHACLEPGQVLALPPLGRVLVPTGLQLMIPPGFEGQVRPRSGWALKHGVTILNSPGTIDSDYRGEVRVLLINLGTTEVSIAPGERIAQLVLARVWQAQLTEVAVLDETERGAGGFGHTGRG
ncbi:MAG TPA: dUTP diphosphatase [Pseudomonadota bacterium]|nr:dUTP diphosphatase [Pseudomonadota bacterium]